MGDTDGSKLDSLDALLRAMAAAPPRVRPVDEDDPPRVAHFRILGRLGRGGMGVVCHAEDTRLAREIALKVLPRASMEGEHRRRFLREARLAASIDHPNVARVHEVGQDEGRIFIAMEKVPGSTLRACIPPSGLPADAVRAVALQIARGLAAAHDNGIIHRDLKPENVMVTSDGVVKLLDFGLAKSVVPLEASTAVEHAETETQITEEGHILGTTAYMSPEQAVGVPLDARSDVFSFGVMLYEMMTGARPFAAPSAGQVRMAIIREAATPPSRRVPAVDPKLEAIAMRCLEKSPRDRFVNAGALAFAIESGRLEDAPRNDPLPQRRWPMLRYAAVVIALAGGLVAWRGLPSLPRRSGVPASPMSPSAVVDETCIRESDCARSHPREAWHCNAVRHTCVPVASVDCTADAEPGDRESDDLVWLGGMFPLSSEPAFTPEAKAAALARSEFSDALGSSRSRAGEFHARPIGFVLCDEGKDPVRAAKHLADDVEVPAVLGFRGPKSAVATIPPVFLPRRVLTFITIAQQAELTALPEPPGEPRLVWRSTLDMTSQRAPTSALLDGVLEPMVRSRRGAGATDRPLRVAVVQSSARARDYTDEQFHGLRSKPRERDVRQFVHDAASGDGGLARTIEDVVAFAPDIVDEATGAPARLVPPLEARWPPSVPPPLYIVGSEFNQGLLDFIGKDKSRRQRFFALTNVSTSENAELVLRYNVRFPNDGVTPTDSPQPSYDAFYVLAYATYALGDAAITGPALSRAIGRLLPPAPPVDVGPAHIFEAIEKLRSGANIDLVGAMGSLDFDPATGEAPVDYAVVCCGVAADGSAKGSMESGLVYDTRKSKLVGELRCP